MEGIKAFFKGFVAKKGKLAIFIIAVVTLLAFGFIKGFFK